MPKLEYRLTAGKVPETVFAECLDVRKGRQVIAAQIVRRLGQQRLPAVAGRKSRQAPLCSSVGAGEISPCISASPAAQRYRALSNSYGERAP